MQTSVRTNISLAKNRKQKSQIKSSPVSSVSMLNNCEGKELKKKKYFYEKTQFMYIEFAY